MFTIKSSASCPSLQYFSTLSQKLHDFRKINITEHQTCVLIFSPTLSEKFLIPKRIEGDMIKNVYCLSCKVPVVLVRLQ